jgi:2'-5' RNA ligase
MNAERWRCFVAVPIGEGLRGELAAAVDGWRVRPGLAGLRWTDPAGWHVTLAFLGSIDASSVPELAARLEPIRDRAPMRLAAGGLGAFPSRARARVAWYGIADPDRRLAQLAADVARALDLDLGAPFRGHVTLARARKEPIDLRPWLAWASAPVGELVVERVELMRSHTGRGPARYETLATMRLGVQSGV